MDKIYKNYIWIIIILSLIGYFAYRVMSFQGSIQSAIRDPQSWIQLVFVIWLNVNMVSASYDGATNKGLQSEEFTLADELNNRIITSVNNEMKSFRDYVKALNQHELITMQEDYLFKVGDKTVEELTEKELKEYNNLKPVRHNIYGFNLPLYYEMTKSGQVNYLASIRKNQGKRARQVKKIFTGSLFGLMTINMFFMVENVGNAFISLLIISVGLLMTYVMTFVPQLFKFKYDIPKKVILKNTLYNSYIDFKNGKHILKKLEVKENVSDERDDKGNN